MRTRPGLVAATALGVALVVLGTWMVVAGWPMRNPAETALIDLAQLPMSAAVLVGVVEMTWTHRLWVRSPRAFVGVFGPAAVALLLGVVIVAVAYGTGHRTYSGTGQLLIWIGVGLAFTYLAIDSLRRELADHRPLLVDTLDGDLDHLADWDDDPDSQDADPDDNA